MRRGDNALAAKARSAPVSATITLSARSRLMERPPRPFVGRLGLSAPTPGYYLALPGGRGGMLSIWRPGLTSAWAETGGFARAGLAAGAAAGMNGRAIWV